MNLHGDRRTQHAERERPSAPAVSSTPGLSRFVGVTLWAMRVRIQDEVDGASKVVQMLPNVAHLNVLAPSDCWPAPPRANSGARIGSRPPRCGSGSRWLTEHIDSGRPSHAVLFRTEKAPPRATARICDRGQHGWNSSRIPAMRLPGAIHNEDSHFVAKDAERLACGLHIALR